MWWVSCRYRGPVQASHGHSTLRLTNTTNHNPQTQVEAASAPLSPTRQSLTFKSARFEPITLFGIDVTAQLPKPKARGGAVDDRCVFESSMSCSDVCVQRGRSDVWDRQGQPRANLLHSPPHQPRAHARTHACTRQFDFINSPNVGYIETTFVNERMRIGRSPGGPGGGGGSIFVFVREK